MGKGRERDTCLLVTALEEPGCRENRPGWIAANLTKLHAQATISHPTAGRSFRLLLPTQSGTSSVSHRRGQKHNQWPKAHATDVTMWGLVLLEGAILHAVLFWGGRTHNCQCTGPPPCWKGKTNEVNINGVCWDGDSSKQISWKNYNSGEGQQRIRESDMLTAFAGIKT